MSMSFAFILILNRSPLFSSLCDSLPFGMQQPSFLILINFTPNTKFKDWIQLERCSLVNHIALSWTECTQLNAQCVLFGFGCHIQEDECSMLIWMEFQRREHFTIKAHIEPNTSIELRIMANSNPNFFRSDGPSSIKNGNFQLYFECSSAWKADSLLNFKRNHSFDSNNSKCKIIALCSLTKWVSLLDDKRFFSSNISF